ncbi:MAG TPA: prepilin-type N-terminal cleavage/methylation domain-containing protein [Gemmatimonadaceae bacterium]|nr:prepilin-type N-terminal cleavage/methylation domain-containing protein [Gemmatimonadaceae bacterium]
MRHSRSAGFTLIELLVVVVIIGILASIAIPKFSNTKGKSYAAAIKSDLRNLATAEESYYYSNDTYTADLGALNFNPTAGVTITISEATAGGWGATATRPGASVNSCALFFGSVAPVAPATVEASIVCN